MTRRVRVWGPAWATMVLIFVLSSISGLGPIPGGVDDGVAHALQYAVLAALLLRGVKVRAAALAVLLATLYGVTDEAHQWFVPGRTAEVTDLVADALGAAVAAGVICGWSIVRRS